MIKLHFTLPKTLEHSQISILCEAIDDLCASHSIFGSSEELWTVELLCDIEQRHALVIERIVEQAMVHDITIPKDIQINQESLPECNWLEYAYNEFEPFSIGPFFIYGAHDAGKVPDGQYGLQIDAATAFGSGSHGTTKGCLEAMLDLKGQGACPWNVLDMGTGSGILAIAACKLWKTPVMAIDNDPEAARVCERHREINNVPNSPTDLNIACGDGFETELVQQKKPYDLIIANILVSALREMAQDLVAVADHMGYVVLSGILDEQAEEIIELYKECGLNLRKTLSHDGWCTLVLQKG